MRAVATALAILPVIVLAQVTNPLTLCSNTNTASGAGTFFVSNSYGKCTENCQQYGYAFAIMQGNTCWCSNDAPADTTSVSDCSQSCPGYPSDRCGNTDEGLFGYAQIGQASATVGSSSSMTSSSSSMPSSSSSSYSSSSLLTSTSSTSSSSSSSSSSSLLTSTSSSFSSSSMLTSSSEPSISSTSTIFSSSESSFVTSSSTSAGSTSSTLTTSSIVSTSSSQTSSSAAAESSTLSSSTFSETSSSSSSSSIPTTTSLTSVSSSSTALSSSSGASSSDPASSASAQRTSATGTPSTSSIYSTSSTTGAVGSPPTATNGSPVGRNQNRDSFWDDSSKVGGTFAAVGIVGAALLGILIWLLWRWRKNRKEKAALGMAVLDPASTPPSKGTGKASSGGGSHHPLAVLTRNTSTSGGYHNSPPMSSTGSPGHVRTYSGFSETDLKLVPIFDQRVDPNQMYMRWEHGQSSHSLQDNEDYSRRVLRVANPTHDSEED